MSLALKVCGMLHNTPEVARLQPDYLGFIFYEKSPRYVSHSHIESLLPESNSIKTTKNVGVFVNASVNFIIKQCKAFNLNVIQLHGEESVAFIKSLAAAIHSDHSLQPLNLWKVFSIKDHFNFDVLNLPLEAQLSPVYAIAISDFDKDGDQDIILGGNLNGVKPEFGRYDASFGTYLENKGNLNFEFHKSGKGLKVNGQIRDLQVIKNQLFISRNNDSLNVYKY